MQWFDPGVCVLGLLLSWRFSCVRGVGLWKVSWCVSVGVLVLVCWKCWSSTGAGVLEVVVCWSCWCV